MTPSSSAAAAAACPCVCWPPPPCLHPHRLLHYRRPAGGHPRAPVGVAAAHWGFPLRVRNLQRSEMLMVGTAAPAGAVAGAAAAVGVPTCQGRQPQYHGPCPQKCVLSLWWPLRAISSANEWTL
eukprot:1159278-Pelagomonas_calceolata.AAC.9